MLTFKRASAEGKFHSAKLERLHSVQNHSGSLIDLFRNKTVASVAEPDFFEQRYDYYFKYCRTSIFSFLFKNMHSKIGFLLFYFQVIMIMVWILGSIRSSLFFTLCIRASRNLHKKMFDTIICTPIRFFDTNPIGIYFYIQLFFNLTSLKRFN
jgi:hypothetical protein